MLSQTVESRSQNRPYRIFSAFFFASIAESPVAQSPKVPLPIEVSLPTTIDLPMEQSVQIAGQEPLEKPRPPIEQQRCSFAFPHKRDKTPFPYKKKSPTHGSHIADTSTRQNPQPDRHNTETFRPPSLQIEEHKDHLLPTFLEKATKHFLPTAPTNDLGDDQQTHPQAAQRQALCQQNNPNQSATTNRHLSIGCRGGHFFDTTIPIVHLPSATNTILRNRAISPAAAPAIIPVTLYSNSNPDHGLNPMPFSSPPHDF